MFPLSCIYTGFQYKLPAYLEFWNSEIRTLQYQSVKFLEAPAEEPESSESRNENQSVQSAKLVEIRLMSQRPNPMSQRR